MSMFNYESEDIYKQVRGETQPSSPVYVAECKKEILEEVSPNYPQLVEYEKEWLNFAKNIYHDGTPVPLEYQEVKTDEYATVNNAIPFYYKSAILSGNTLVNLALTKKQVTVTGGSTGWNHVTGLSYNLIPNKKYLIKLDIVDNTLDSGIMGVNLLFRQIGIGGSTLYSPPLSELENGRMVITVGENYTNIDSISICANSSATSGTLTIDNFMIIEYQNGMENWDIPYFEGMQSVKMPVLTTTGKNLYSFGDANFISTHTSWHDTLGGHNMFGSNVPNSKAKFMLKAGNYRLSFGEAANFNSIQLITEDEIVIKTGTGSFELTADTYLILRGSVSTPNEISSLKNIQIEQGTQKTTYEPYKTNILKVNEDIELRGIGEVADELNLLTGEYVQRIGEVVFDGSDDEAWQKYQTNDNAFIAFSNVPLPNTLGIKYTNTKMIVDDFKVVSTMGVTADGCYISNTSKFNLSVSTTKATTVSELKNYLQSNPITVQYQLATESVKTVDLSTSIKPYNDINHYHVSSDTIPPHLSLSVPVVSTGAQTLNDIITEG